MGFTLYIAFHLLQLCREKVSVCVWRRPVGWGSEFGVMEIAESSTGRGAHGMLGFPGAAQPEVMRAAEKDEHYVASLSDACHEAFRHALGMSFLQECHMDCSNKYCCWDAIIDFPKC